MRAIITTYRFNESDDLAVSADHYSPVNLRAAVADALRADARVGYAGYVTLTVDGHPVERDTWDDICSPWSPPAVRLAAGEVSK